MFLGREARGLTYSCGLPLNGVVVYDAGEPGGPDEAVSTLVMGRFRVALDWLLADVP